MERTIGVDEAGAGLGRIAEDVASGNGPVVLTRWGRRLAVILSESEYVASRELARRLAAAELRARLFEIRERVAAAGLDESLVDEALRHARDLV